MYPREGLNPPLPAQEITQEITRKEFEEMRVASEELMARQKIQQEETRQRLGMERSGATPEQWEKMPASFKGYYVERAVIDYNRLVDQNRHLELTYL